MNNVLGLILALALASFTLPVTGWASDHPFSSNRSAVIAGSLLLLP
jgi:hypothetical protein